MGKTNMNKTAYNKEYGRVWYLKNKEMLKARRVRNSDKKREYDKERRKKNPGRVRKEKRNWYLSNLVKCKTDAKKWAKRNPVKRALISRSRYLRQTYGLTSVEYDELSQHQGGLCALCREDNHGRKLHVDHDHVRNTVRGLLCSNCNTALGLFKESPEVLQRAIMWVSIGIGRPICLKRP